MPTHPYLTQVVHSAARARPDQPCLTFGSRQTTSAEFRDRVPSLRQVVYGGTTGTPKGVMLSHANLLAATAGMLAAIQAHRVTDVMLVPTMLQMVLADPGFAEHDLSSLQRIFSGPVPITGPLPLAEVAIPATVHTRMPTASCTWSTGIRT